MSKRELDEILSHTAILEKEFNADLAKKSLIDFACQTHQSYKINWHHELLASKLEDVANGKLKRLMISMPPRHGKTELASIRFGPWYLGKHPTHNIIQATYSAEFAEENAKKSRSIVLSPTYREIFGFSVARDSRAVSRWQTEKGGSYYAVGVGGPLTGRGANLILIDDPHKNRQEAESLVVRKSVWDWFTSTAYTRLEDNGAIIVIMCMTGDTPVLMADGSERSLREIKVGDQVATYDNGKLEKSTVLNHRSNGLDFVFRIKMTCGKIVHANARHPFLVNENGQLKWIKLKNLTTAHTIVALKDNGANGKAKLVSPEVVSSLLVPEGTARHITIKRDGLMVTALRRLMPFHAGKFALNFDTESPSKNTMQCLKRKMVNVLYASSLLEITCELIGAASYALITATKLIKSGLFCAMTAILRWATPSQKKLHSILSNTSDFTTEVIESIEPAGVEEVFDVQIERTENFIANGLVSHNTRWHEADLIGCILAGEEKWEYICLPAIAEQDDQYRHEGDPLWPQKYDIDALKNIKLAIGSKQWESLYQQRPSAAEGEIFKRQYWKYYQFLPIFQKIVHSWDTAFKKGAENDYSVCTIWGVTATGYFLIYRWKERVEFPELKRTVVALAAQIPPNEILIEDKASGQSLIQELQRETRLPIIPYKIDGDKVARANAVTPIIEAGKVFLPEDAEWLQDYIDTLAAFPNAVHDDDVDSTTQALSSMQNFSGIAFGTF